MHSAEIRTFPSEGKSHDLLTLRVPAKPNDWLALAQEKRAAGSGCTVASRCSSWLHALPIASLFRASSAGRRRVFPAHSTSNRSRRLRKSTFRPNDSRFLRLAELTTPRRRYCVARSTVAAGTLPSQSTFSYRVQKGITPATPNQAAQSSLLRIASHSVRSCHSLMRSRFPAGLRTRRR